MASEVESTFGMYVFIERQWNESCLAQTPNKTEYNFGGFNNLIQMIFELFYCICIQAFLQVCSRSLERSDLIPFSPITT